MQTDMQVALEVCQERGAWEGGAAPPCLGEERAPGPSESSALQATQTSGSQAPWDQQPPGIWPVGPGGRTPWGPEETGPRVIPETGQKDQDRRQAPGGLWPPPRPPHPACHSESSGRQKGRGAVSPSVLWRRPGAPVCARVPPVARARRPDTAPPHLPCPPPVLASPGSSLCLHSPPLTS